MWNYFSQTLKGDGIQEISSNFIWLSTAFYIVLKIWLLSSIPWLCSPQLQSGPALFPILNSSDSTPSSFSPVRNTIPKGRPAKVSFESSQGPNCSKPFSPFTMYPKHSPSIGEVKSLPSLSCSFQIGCPTFQWILISSSRVLLFSGPSDNIPSASVFLLPHRPWQHAGLVPGGLSLPA